MGESDDGSIFLTRRGLYDKVWSKAMRKLGPELGISDVGLKKLCRRFKIPTPPAGYWAKVAHGKKVRKPRFVKWPEDDDPECGITFFVTGENSPPGEHLAAEVKQQAEPILVPDELSDPHPLVVATEKSLLAAGEDEQGLVWPRAEKTLDVHVSPENIPRAMRIMDAFVRALEARGLPVTVDSPEGNRRTETTVLQESVGFMLYEATDRVEREPTARERDLSWHRQKKYYRRVPSGRLGLRITSSAGWGRRRCWVDDRRRKLDVQLRSVLAAIYRTAESIKAEKREAEEQERQRRQQERERQEKLEEIRQEEKRLQELTADADAWSKAQQLRSYVQAVRHDAGCKGRRKIVARGGAKA